MSSIKIIDVEASGLHPDSYPIEIGVLIDGEVHCWLIKPSESWTFWDDHAEEIHGISRNQLQEEGLDAYQVANELNGVMDGTDGILYSDAASWDYGWLQTLFQSTGVHQTFHIHPLSEVIPEDKVRDYNIHFERLVHSDEYNHHRAEDDVQMIYQAYCDTMEPQQ
ncbi:3'-5' exonuclease [Aurantivibrio plasticivorans]